MSLVRNIPDVRRQKLAKKKDILSRMAENPRGDWRMEDLIKAADHAGLIVRAPSHGSHYTFASSYLERIETVPHKRPVKPIYVKRFCKFIDNHLAAKGANENG